MRVPYLSDLSDNTIAILSIISLGALVYLLSTSPQMLMAVKSLDAGGLKNSLIASGTVGMIMAVAALGLGIACGIEIYGRGPMNFVNRLKSDLNNRGSMSTNSPPTQARVPSNEEKSLDFE